MKKLWTALLLLSICAAPAFAEKYDVSIPADFVNS